MVSLYFSQSRANLTWYFTNRLDRSYVNNAYVSGMYMKHIFSMQGNKFNGISYICGYILG
ncbi:hypothetical protein EV401DRAFT_2036415, partial [Pisolithus croceorrhizus]